MTSGQVRVEDNMLEQQVSGEVGGAALDRMSWPNVGGLKLKDLAQICQQISYSSRSLFLCCYEPVQAQI